MGWGAIYRNGTVEHEGDTKTLPDGTLEGVGRPVQAGENGELVCVTQEDYGHTVAIDLINGMVAIDYEAPLTIQNGTLELQNPKIVFAVCEETVRVGELKNLEPRYDQWYRCNKTKFIDWYQCPEKIMIEKEGEIECDKLGGPEPGICENGHQRIALRKQVACEYGSTEQTRCENNHKRKPLRREDDGTLVTVKSDIVHDLIWRPIWFTRNINGDPTKIIGAQTTLPEVHGGGNVKKLIMLYSNGMIGID